MLTILETVREIKALPTSKDIILGACQQVVSGRSSESPPDTIESVAKEIAMIYIDRLPSHEFLLALATCLSVSASIIAKEGKEAELLTQIFGFIRETFSNAHVGRFRHTMETDPEKGIKQLMAMIARIDERD
jgi:hypothetical protein